MVSMFLLLFSGVLAVDSAALFLPSDVDRFYKSRSILQVPGGNNPGLTDTIASGAQMAMDHCQMVFKWDRWNCPPSTFSRQSKQLPTKETAYAKAILSAGIVHAVTKNCSRGEIEGCGCDPNPENPSTISSQNWINLKTDILSESNGQAVDWSWGGCSDDPKFALDIAKKVLDGLEKGTDAAGFVGRHNNRVGREIVRDSMVSKCRCHGTSGSCSLQTCWMQLAPFAEISRKLKARYRAAVRINYEKVEKSVVLENSARVKTQKRELPVNEKSLIFLEPSPDYCIGNVARDFPGTKGRACSRSNSSLAEKRSCRNLCRSCGYSVKRMKREVTKECNCRFSWCCTVTCETCTEIVEEYFCE